MASILLGRESCDVNDATDGTCALGSAAGVGSTAGCQGLQPPLSRAEQGCSQACGQGDSEGVEVGVGRWAFATRLPRVTKGVFYGKVKVFIGGENEDS